MDFVHSSNFCSLTQIQELLLVDDFFFTRNALTLTKALFAQRLVSGEVRKSGSDILHDKMRSHSFFFA